MRLTRTVGPRTQQRRLSAAGRSRDDRHLLRRRAIESGEKITPADQPGLCPIHRQKACLGACAGRPAAGDPVLSVSGQRTQCQRVRITRIRRPPFTCLAASLGSVTKVRTAVYGRAQGSRGFVMGAHVAIVAGAGGALGHATTATLAASGLTVVAADRNEHALRDLPGGVRPEVADTPDPAAVIGGDGRLAGEVGPPDGRVSPAGTGRDADALTPSPETPRLMIGVDLGRGL